MMEKYEDHNVPERLSGMTRSIPPDRLVAELHEYARDLLSSEYPRQRLYEDFEAVRAEMRERDEEEREDAVMDVMDCLVGWCSPNARL